MEKKGYEFAGWYIDPERKKKLNPGGILPRVTMLYDKWVPVWHPIKYEMHGGTNSRLNPRYINIEAPSYILFPPKKKNTYFREWLIDGMPVLTTPTHHYGPLTIEAHFETPCKVSFETFGGPIIKPMEVSGDGFLHDLRKPSRLGYIFQGWFIDDQFMFPFMESNKISSDCTLYAKWDPIVYNVSYDANGGIPARSNPSSYTIEDHTHILKPAQRRGYIFDGWYNKMGIKTEFIRQHSVGDRHYIAKWISDEL